MSKHSGMLALSLMAVLPALADTTYHCTESENTIVPFTLVLATGPTRLAHHNDAVVKSEDGTQVSSGDYFWHVIDDHTRLAGLTSYHVQTQGDFGKITLNLIGDNLHLFGNGTVGEGASEETILLGCKVQK